MVYTNLKSSSQGKHGMFESSKLDSAENGPIHDVLVVDAEGKEIDCDNGVPVKVGAYTGNGLQERKATIAAVGDKISVIGTPAIVKDGYSRASEQPYMFYNKAGKDAKAYAILEHEEDVDIFAVADYQFTEASAKDIKIGAYVVTDGNGMWIAQTSAPAAATYGFIGQVHSIAYDSVGFANMVRIQVLQNVQK